MEPVAIETPHGRANAHLRPAEQPRAALVLGHGAGGGVTARDLVTAADAALAEGVSVALVEQPYRVAGRRSPAPAHHLDAAWLAIVEQLRADVFGDLPLVTGGRSSGARVACRTAGAAGGVGSALPRVPAAAAAPDRAARRAGSTSSTACSSRRSSSRARATRSGCRRRPRSARSSQVQGDHSLRTDLAAIAAAVRSWLAATL